MTRLRRLIFIARIATCLTACARVIPLQPRKWCKPSNRIKIGLNPLQLS